MPCSTLSSLHACRSCLARQQSHDFGPSPFPSSNRIERAARSRADAPAEARAHRRKQLPHLLRSLMGPLISQNPVGSARCAVILEHLVGHEKIRRERPLASARRKSRNPAHAFLAQQKHQSFDERIAGGLARRPREGFAVCAASAMMSGVAAHRGHGFVAAEQDCPYGRPCPIA